MLRVEISAAAERDLEEIAEYIARDDIVAAEGWVAKLVALARAAATNPRAGRVVPEWRDERVREVFLRTYRVIYRIEERKLVVLAFVEGRRRLRAR